MAGKMWMIRGDGGKLYDGFRDKQVVAISWSQLAPYCPHPKVRKTTPLLPIC